ncbi:hypothetical protein B0A49_06720 [Cryomyces minteri]|uniref:Uncharacterized protein n=1 Tax=Cryomyces minteri TaxID=331657 RepID=A0A4U0WV87_9PEZI|nr:hypothetical protein B0A49_06720 [Cryomyces minteri]
MLDDTAKCFNFLNDNLPRWFENLDEIEKKVEERHKEFAVTAVPMHKPRKSGSTESLRPAQTQHEDDVAIVVTPAQQAKDDAPLPSQGQLQAAKRKRKPASVISGNASGPSKYRNRSMMIVYYDSEVQKQFEALVRHVGTARNLLRKAKMSARMTALTASNTGDDDGLDYDGEEAAAFARVGYKSRIGMRTPRTEIGQHDATSRFDLADNAMDRAQNACERAAHQFLRDGDCSPEIENAREEFESLMEMSREELARLKDQRSRVQNRNNSTTKPADLGVVTNIKIDDEDGDDEDEDGFKMPPALIPMARRVPT